MLLENSFKKKGEIIMEDRKTYLDEVEKELERRIELIEGPDYEFIPGMSKLNKTLALLLGVICFISIIVVYQVYS